MKILLIGIDFFGYSESLQKAFERLGHTVITHNIQQGWGVLGKIHREIYNIYHSKIKNTNPIYRFPKFLREKRSKSVVELYNKESPDLIVAFPGYGLTKKALEKMKNAHKTIWLYDSITRLPEMPELLKEYDTIFTFEGSDVQQIEKMGMKAEFLPLCADDSIYYPIAQEKDIDILFIGNLSRSRVESLLDIRDKMPDIRMVVYGRYSKTLEKDKTLHRRLLEHSDIFTNQLVSASEARDLYARSKICVNLHHGQSKYGANMRLYEICATNSFQVVDSNPYITDGYQGCMIITNNTSEMIDAITYYLLHDEERREIADNGYKRIIQSELFLHRAKKIIDCSLKNQKQGD